MSGFITNCPKKDCADYAIYLRENQILCMTHGIVYTTYAESQRYDSIDNLVRCNTCGTPIDMKYTDGFQPALRPYCIKCDKFLQMKNMMLSLDWQSIGHIIELINRLKYMSIKSKELTKPERNEEP